MSTLILDTLDDRREIHTLLRKLHPEVAVEWLAAQCRKVKPINGCRPNPARKMQPRIQAALRDDDAASRLSLELYYDVWALGLQYDLDLTQAALSLERLVKACR